LESYLTARFKLWLCSSDAEGVFGDGKWRLLQAIDQTGSLRAAAKRLGISYRKAWGDLNKAEQHLHVHLIEKHRGGQSGGTTRLTEAGRRWLNAYSRFRADVEAATRQAYRIHIEHLAAMGVSEQQS